MQSLLSHFPIHYQPTPVTHRGPQRIHRRLLDVRPASTLTGQIRQRRTVTVIGLKPA